MISAVYVQDRAYREKFYPDPPMCSVCLEHPASEDEGWEMCERCAEDLRSEKEVEDEGD